MYAYRGANLVYLSIAGSTRASSPVGTRRTTNRQIDGPAERHVPRNITLKPGSVSKNRDATGRQDFAQWRKTCSACLLPARRHRVGHGSLFQNPTQPKISGPNPTPTHKSLHPTQPIIDTWYGILGYTENFIQQLLHVTDKFTVRS